MTQSNDRIPSITGYTLEQLNAMSREDFIKHFPQTSQRWKNKGYLVNANSLMKAAIYATAKIDWPIDVDNVRGPREVWYNPIKPIVMRAIGLRANNNDGPFEKLLSKIVKSGKLAYIDLGIRDFRTMREIYEAIDKAECWKNILLFVEKDSAYVHLRPLKEFLNINIMSGAGWSNTSGIEAQLTDMRERGVTEIEIYTVVDYDAFGFAINKEFADKCEMMGFKVTSHKRIGMGIEHTTPELLEVQKYPVKPGKKLTVNGISFDSDKWLAEYGIEGKYGIEIEAISGQPGGHKKLRMIVLQELLKYLNENDRIDELLTDRWDDIEREVLEFHLDVETLDAWKELGVDRTLREYITSSEYESRCEEIETEKEESTAESQLELDSLEEKIEQKRNNWDNYIAEEYSKFQEQIDELRKKYILPLQEERDSIIEIMRDNRNEDLSPLENKSGQLEGFIGDLEGPYDTKLSYLAEEYQKSRALFAEAVWDWLLDNCEYYYDLGRTVEDLSFGLMTGFLMKAMENGETLKDLFERVATFDSERACEYISIDIDEDADIQAQINENLQQLIASALKGAA